MVILYQKYFYLKIILFCQKFIVVDRIVSGVRDCYILHLD